MTFQNFSLKTAFLAFSITFTCLSFAGISLESVSDCYNNQADENRDWKYLEFFLIVQPKNQIDAFNFDLSTKICAAFATASLGHLTLTKSSQSSSAAYISIMALFGAFGLKYSSSVEKQIKHNALLNFIQNWSYHRSFVPEEVVSAFDELSTYIKESRTFSDEQVSTIFEVIQHLIEHQFEKRYPKEKKSADLIGTFKTITEIGKNASGK